MECKHCKSSWNSSLTVTNCPFCGKYILAETNDNMTLPESITSIVSEYGIDILNDSKRLISLIIGYVRDCDKEKKLLKIACECGILKMSIDIKECPEGQRAFLIQKAVKKLEDNAFLSSENAEYIVSLIMIGLDIPYKSCKHEDQQHVAATATQTIQANVKTEPRTSSSYASSTPISTESNAERYRNIVTTNSSSSSVGKTEESVSVTQKREPVFEQVVSKLVTTHSKVKYGFLNIVIKNSISPLALANGATYCFVIDSKNTITLIAGKGDTTETIEISCGDHTLSLCVYGWDDPEMRKSPSYTVKSQNFRIIEGKTTHVVANRPGMFSSQTLKVSFE